MASSSNLQEKTLSRNRKATRKLEYEIHTTKIVKNWVVGTTYAYDSPHMCWNIDSATLESINWMSSKQELRNNQYKWPSVTMQLIPCSFSWTIESKFIITILLLWLAWDLVNKQKLWQVWKTKVERKRTTIWLTKAWQPLVQMC